MNNIVERILNEKIWLEKDYIRPNQYTYHYGKQLITYPAFDNLDSPESVFCLAHELGHYYQTKYYGSILLLFSSMSRLGSLFNLIFFPFLFWEEIDAWRRAWLICKEEKISCEGFISISLRSLFSYIKVFFLQIIQVIKYLLGIYLSIVFTIRFLIVSEEMNLNQPEWVKALRVEIVSNGKPTNEIVTELFRDILVFGITILIIFVLVEFLLQISKLPMIKANDN